MKKRLGIIRKIKKKHIFLALLAVIVLGGLAKAYSAWVGTTRIAFLNYQAIALGQMSHANDNAMIASKCKVTKKNEMCKKYPYISLCTV